MSDFITRLYYEKTQLTRFVQGAKWYREQLKNIL